MRLGFLTIRIRLHDIWGARERARDEARKMGKERERGLDHSKAANTRTNSWALFLRPSDRNELYTGARQRNGKRVRNGRRRENEWGRMKSEWRRKRRRRMAKHTWAEELARWAWMDRGASGFSSPEDARRLWRERGPIYQWPLRHPDLGVGPIRCRAPKDIIFP